MALHANSVRDLKTVVRAINFVLKNNVDGEPAIESLCHLLEATAELVRHESIDKRYVGRDQLGDSGK